MKNLLYKEFALCAHPTNFLFLGLSVLLLVPNYPYLVTFFYTGLAVFFVCLSGRENEDILYTALLPVAKKELVKARFCFVIILELLQVATAVPFALLRQKLPLPGNAVGLDANIALFGCAFVMLGLFNLVFFVNYYKRPEKVGGAFAKACVATTVFLLAVETCTHAVPFVLDTIDTPDPDFLLYKLQILAAGIVVYVLFTTFALHRSARSFEALDL